MTRGGCIFNIGHLLSHLFFSDYNPGGIQETNDALVQLHIVSPKCVYNDNNEHRSLTYLTEHVEQKGNESLLLSVTESLGSWSWLPPNDWSFHLVSSDITIYKKNFLHKHLD